MINHIEKQTFVRKKFLHSFIHFFSVSKFKHLLREVGRKVVKCVNYRKHLVTSFPVLFWTPKIGHWKNGNWIQILDTALMGEGWANFWSVKDRLPPSLQKRKPCCPQQDLWENLNPPFGKAPKGRWKFKVPQDPIKLPPSSSWGKNSMPLKGCFSTFVQLYHKYQKCLFLWVPLNLVSTWEFLRSDLERNSNLTSAK